MHFKAQHFRQNAGHAARVGAAIVFTSAFLLTSGIFNKSYSQNTWRKKKGDYTLLYQTGAFKQEDTIKKDTIAPKKKSTLDSIPKIVVPDVRTLEHYNPFPGQLTDSMFINKDPYVKILRTLWLEMCDQTPPFGLSQKVISKYSKTDREELMRRWEIAKKELAVAFLSDKGVTPANALKVHAPAEVEEMLRQWEWNKKSIKKDQTPPPMR